MLHVWMNRGIYKGHKWPLAPYVPSLRVTEQSLQHTATHCNTLHHTATHCNTLQHTATRYTSLHHTAQHCNKLQRTRDAHVNESWHTTTHAWCTRWWGRTRWWVRAHKRNQWPPVPHMPSLVEQSLQHTATHCNTLQHTAPHLDIL